MLGLDETNPPLRLEASQPVLTLAELEQLKNIGASTKNLFKSLVLDITYDANLAQAGMAAALENLNSAAQKAVHNGFNVLILSDRTIAKNRIAIPHC